MSRPVSANITTAMPSAPKDDSSEVASSTFTAWFSTGRGMAVEPSHNGSRGRGAAPLPTTVV